MFSQIIHRELLEFNVATAKVFRRNAAKRAPQKVVYAQATNPKGALKPNFVWVLDGSLGIRQERRRAGVTKQEKQGRRKSLHGDNKIGKKAMADYRLSVNIISRGKGQSVVACAAYRAGAELTDERYGNQQDYTKRRGVLHTEIVLPSNAPAFAHDREQLWNRLEDAELHPRAQLAREIQLSLPHELTGDQRRGLVMEFARYMADQYGFALDTAIHAPSHAPGADGRNFHAHILFPTRRFDGASPSGFSRQKDRRFNDVSMKREGRGNEIEHLREVWEDIQNRELERLDIRDAEGNPVRVDRRSYERQGVDREPAIHEGVEATGLKRRGEFSERVAFNLGAAEFNLQIADRNRQIDEMTERVAGHFVDICRDVQRLGRSPARDNLRWQYRNEPWTLALYGDTSGLERDGAKLLDKHVVRPAAQIADATFKMSEGTLDVGGMALDTAGRIAGALGEGLANGLVSILEVFTGTGAKPAPPPQRREAAREISRVLDGLELMAERKRQVGRESDQQFDDEAALKRRKSYGMQF